MSESNEVTPGGTTRRDLLRRTGIVVGLAWTAPVLQSLASPAFAAGSPPNTGDPGTISWVVVFVKCGTIYYAIKFEQSTTGYTEICYAGTSLVGNGGDADCQTAWTDFSSEFAPTTGCPDHVYGYSSNGNLVVHLGSCSLVAYIVHDGQIPPGPGCWASDGTTTIGSPNGTNFTFGAPSLPGTGTVEFTKTHI